MFLGLCIFIAAHVIWAAQPTLAKAGSLSPRQSTQPTKPTGHVAASWYTSWHAEYVPLASVNWTEYNMVFYSFVWVQRIYSVGIYSSSPSQCHDVKLLRDWPSSLRCAINSSVCSDCPPTRMLSPFLFPSLPFLTQGVFQNVLAIASVGGWGGSQFFSSAVATDANRTAFANAIVNLVSQYQLDGIEIECALLLSSEVLSTHRPIVGNIPVNKESVATLYPRTIAPTSFCFCKRFVP